MSSRPQGYESHQSPSPGTLHTAAYTSQLLQELGLQSITYHTTLQSRLDREAAARSAIHRAALASAYSEHERVLRNAQWAQEQLEADIARKREEEDLRDVQRNHEEETQRFEKEIQQQRYLLEERRRDAEAEKERVREELAREELAARDRERNREEEETRTRDRLNQQQKQQQPDAGTSQVNGNGLEPMQQSERKNLPTSRSDAVLTPSSSTGPALTTVSSEDREATHRSYLELHQRLKVMRKTALDSVKNDPTLKKQLGEMRRDIRKSVGQLTMEPSANMVPLRRIKDTLNTAKNLRTGTIPVTSLIISQPIPSSNDPGNPTSHLPLPFVYLMSIFAKAIISQFIAECSVSPRSADPIGIVAISIFANNDLRAFTSIVADPSEGTSLIDILLAKFHKVCPILFVPNTAGADESSPQGRLRLGWWRDVETGAFVPEQRHGERMTGLGAGFAALSLRDFKNARSKNPMPPRTYWSAIAGLVNVGAPGQPGQITSTHCLVLRAMIEHHVPKFVGFYGHAAIAVLRIALVEVPRRAPVGAATTALATLKEVVRRDCHLAL